MDDKLLNQVVDEIEKELDKKGLSRRDVLKLAGIGGVGVLLGQNDNQIVTKAHASSNAKGKIVIVGGGLAGISTAAKLSSRLSNPDITIIEPNSEIYYQPGYTLVAAGVYDPNDVVYKTADFIPSGVKWIQDRVIEFKPDNNSVVTEKNGEIKYDFLVVATGLQINFDAIEGLNKDLIGTNGIACIYTHEGATKTWKLMQEFCQKGGEGVFTSPATPIKCGGAPKKIQFLTDSYARKIGTRNKINTTLYDNAAGYFGVPEYAKLIEGFYKEKEMKANFGQNLVKIDPATREATFAKKVKVKVGRDEILDEDKFEERIEHTTVKWDFIHITPPMSAPTVVKNSPLAWQKGALAAGGWVEVKPMTLQHARYPNVFCLGDVAGIALNKTGGSVRKQYVVLTENLISVMEGKEPTAKFHGYTVCPLITGYGKVAMLEFDWKEPEKGDFTGKVHATLPFDPLADRWLYWFMKVYMLKPMTMYGMLRGRA